MLERLIGLYNSTGDPLRAEEAIRRIMRVYPGEPLLYLNLGRALLAQQSADQAVQELLVAVSLFPDEAPLWEFLGELQERQQHYRRRRRRTTNSAGSGRRSVNMP